MPEYIKKFRAPRATAKGNAFKVPYNVAIYDRRLFDAVERYREQNQLTIQDFLIECMEDLLEAEGLLPENKETA